MMAYAGVDFGKVGRSNTPACLLRIKEQVAGWRDFLPFQVQQLLINILPIGLPLDSKGKLFGVYGGNMAVIISLHDG
jgi:hypothetical protein